MKKLLLMIAILAIALPGYGASEDAEALRQELLLLKQNYQQQLLKLEQRLEKLEANQNVPTISRAESQRRSTQNNSFNPAISVVLDGKFTQYRNHSESYELPGFTLGGEAGLGEEGFSVGHTELAISSNIDDQFYGKITVAIAEHEGETEIELEEAFIQTLALGNGMTAKAGRFFSSIGYLNEQHQHAWDFADAPLVYRALFGNQLIDDGLQFTLVMPTDTFIELGGEVLRGSRFPGGGEQSGSGAWSLFSHFGGDIGNSHSWQLGLSYFSADVKGRSGEGHSHGELEAETPSFTGDSEISAFDVVYKWAPNGNPTQRNLSVQLEYFDRDEDGEVTLIGSSPLEQSLFDGDQRGWYAQAVYQWQPQWRAGLRYDQLHSDNQGPDQDVLEESGLLDEGLNPKRISTMVEWRASEFSRIRLQYNHDKSYELTDKQWILQYTMSLGAHGAHAF